jgi:hypothetical protein
MNNLRASIVWGVETPNVQTGPTYTFGLADVGNTVDFNSASPQTATIPPHASVAFQAGSTIDLAQMGAGQVTVAPGAGVTLVTALAGLLTRVQYSVGRLRQTSVLDTWIVSGDMT